jgi:hypothetical protein
MKKFLLKEKTIQIVIEAEVISAYPELEPYVVDTPENYVYLLIREQDPTKELKFPQLIGPMSLQNAQQTINDYHNRNREILSERSNNVVGFRQQT